jgi:hypothetical protein
MLEAILDSDRKLKVGKDLKSIKIDVGLAGEAPNSAIWLSETPDRFVLGIEPIPYHWKMIENFETSESLRPYPENFKIVQTEEGVVKLNREVVCSIGDRFAKLECAIDDVEEEEEKDFHVMDRRDGASGSSSLLKPSEHHPHFIEDVIKVKTISLEKILDHVDWDRFPFIEQIKTDCEGKDFDVVRSIGKYLDRILFITSEMTNNTHHWHNSCDQKKFISFMQSKGFTSQASGVGEVLFANKRILQTLNMVQLQLNYKTLGH